MHHRGQGWLQQILRHGGVMRKYGMEWVPCKQCMLLPRCCNGYLPLDSCVACYSVKMAASCSLSKQVSKTSFAAS